MRLTSTAATEAAPGIGRTGSLRDARHGTRLVLLESIGLDSSA
jgi:hypothetical protein